MNNIKQLPRMMVFAVVAQKKSFTAAAKQLGISKSAVSQQVSLLEHDLEVRLLNRTTRELSLTAIGENLLERCKVLQDQLSLAFSDLTQAELNPKGRFSITYPHSLESCVVLPALTQLIKEFPKLEPELIADDTSLDLIENQIDLAIHIGELPSSSNRALRVGTITEIFCATPHYLIQHGPATTLDELCNLRWVSAAWQHSDMNVKCTKSNLVQHVHLNQVANANTLPAAIGMARLNLGAILVPDIAARALLHSGELVRIAKDYTGPEWPIYSVHPYQNDRPIHIARFHQLICRTFNELDSPP